MYKVSMRYTKTCDGIVKDFTNTVTAMSWIYCSHNRISWQLKQPVTGCFTAVTDGLTAMTKAPWLTYKPGTLLIILIITGDVL